MRRDATYLAPKSYAAAPHARQSHPSSSVLCADKHEVDGELALRTELRFVRRPPRAPTALSEAFYALFKILHPGILRLLERVIQGLAAVQIGLELLVE